jgi:hypothetical protein
MTPANTESSLPSYGAVSKEDPDRMEADRPFDANQTYYLRDESRWTTRRIMLVLIPILAAILIMGGISWFLFEDFGHLYPGRGGDYGSFGKGGGGSEPTSTKGVTTSKETQEETTTSSSSKSAGASTSAKNLPMDDIGATCAVRPDCAGLVGYCCPTKEGVMLNCCGR